ncbi:hypothetical protein E2P81_ATG01157 [Venturia nashicola]|nr:hypothetical protein E2P81_ATG01157 [Venturia nashicola]
MDLTGVDEDQNCKSKDEMYRDDNSHHCRYTAHGLRSVNGMLDARFYACARPAPAKGAPEEAQYLSYAPMLKLTRFQPSGFSISQLTGRLPRPAIMKNG